MTTSRFGIGVTSVQSAKPTYAYGSSLQQVPLKSGEALALLRANFASIPKNAVVTSAKVWINQYDGPWSGSNTLTVLRHLAAYTYRATWNTKPAATTAGSQTKTSSAKATWWGIDVTSDVQDMVGGYSKNFGWRLATSSTTLHKMRTHKAAASQPYLEITYEIPSKVPTDLAPQGGAVSTDLPTLTFTCGDDTVSIQVQIDPDANAGSPAFDSGEVAATAGVLDLSTTAYAGLVDGDTTSWRARAKGAAGWSGWSTWAEFSHVDLGVVTLIAPDASPSDGSPPFSWSFTGTQTAYEAFLMSGSKLLDSSGLVSGADTAWTPRKGLTKNGDTGTAIVRVHDDVTRIASPGQPTAAQASTDFTVTFDGAVTPMTTLTATPLRPSPGVTLAGTRSSGGIPDEVIVFRDGVQVARFPGTDIFTSSTAFTYVDWTAPNGIETTYRLAPVVNGAVASGGPTADVTARADGIWLVNPETDEFVVLWGTDPGSWDASDVATVHIPVDEGAQVVRRRLRRGVLSGSITGQVFDAVSSDADEILLTLDSFADADAGTVYRLIAGHLNTACIIGDLLVSPSPSSNSRVRAAAQFNFWGQ